jgi:hypothetical protein
VSENFARYNLEDAIKGAAGKAFASAIERHPEHNFFAFALTTLTNAQYVECSLNSERNMARVLSDAGPSDEGLKAYYKWYPNEWGEFEYFRQGAEDYFSGVNELLGRIESETDAYALSKFGLTKNPFKEGDAHYAEFWEINDRRRHYVFDAMTSALVALDRAGCFGEGEVRRGRIIFADIYDDEFGEELRTQSANAINAGRASPALLQEFLHVGQQ